MTILDLLMKWAGASTSLDALLRQVGNISPELKPTADEWLDKLNQAVTPDNLASLASVLPEEIRDILRGKLSPQDRPSDFA